MRRRPSGVLVPNYLQRSESREDVGRLLGISTWFSFEEVMGHKLPHTQIVAEIARYDWTKVVCGLATWASLLANAPDGMLGEEAQAAITQAFRPYLDGPETGYRRVASHVVSHPGRTAIHERAVYYLQSLAVLHGQENGVAPPSDAWFLLLAFAANDHIPNWGAQAEPDLQLADAAAEMWRASRFNASRDPMRELVRTGLLLRDPPVHGKLLTNWHDLQQQAFGVSFQDFFAKFLGPIACMSVLWGRADGTSAIPTPILRLSAWAGDDRRIRDWFGARTWTRSELATSLTSPSGSFEGSSHAAFFRKPFVEFAPDVLCAFSPYVVWETLRVGPWASMLGATEAVLGRANKDLWFYAFGELTERWCRTVASEAEREARANARPGPQFILSKEMGGEDEVEDVVLRDGERIVLFSVKGKVAPDAIAKGHATNAGIISWLEELLFKKRTGGGSTRTAQRGGAVRLLDAKISRIREGEYEALVGRPVLIVPVLVTYERFQDNGALYAWVAGRCREERLLVGPGVSTMTICDFNEFEILMSLVAKGFDIFRILGRWGDRRRDRRLDMLIAEEFQITLSQSRLEFFDRAFRETMSEIQEAVRARVLVQGE